MQVGENVPLARSEKPDYRQDAGTVPVSRRHADLRLFRASSRAPVVLNDDAAQMKRATSQPFGMAWHQTGDMIWTTREVYADFANPVDPAKWRLESEGPRLRFCLASTHTGKVSEVADPSVSCASSAFSLSSMGGCFPWMLMGETGAVQMWRATGLKLRSAAELPAPVHAMFAQVHPRIFAELPWTDHELPWGGLCKAARAGTVNACFPTEPDPTAPVRRQNPSLCMAWGGGNAAGAGGPYDPERKKSR